MCVCGGGECACGGYKMQARRAHSVCVCLVVDGVCVRVCESVLV